MGLKFNCNYPDFEEVEVSDGRGCSVLIPSRGFASNPEYNEATSLIMTASGKGGEELAMIKEDVVVIMLKSRFPELRSQSRADVLTMDNGEQISAPMLMAIYRFFAEELGIPEDTLDFPIGRYELPKIHFNFAPKDYGKSKNKPTETKPKAA